MDKVVLDFITWAELSGWMVTLKSEPELHLNQQWIARYKIIPDEYASFLRLVSQCMSTSEQTWFLCEADYNNSSNSEFHWNEYELISLEAAANDDVWKSEITSWWDQHLPIMMSVHDGYSYYAIDLSSETGAVVRGEEPEFEEVTKVAEDFPHFLQLMMSGSIAAEDF
ncbi:SMI1/KNR4 family protein [Paenibacillus sp. FSL R7-0652]|jgi:hypothetical protein|uniref:SMI1/KNR4 family protein n=1 Tax=Paenibacillus sp. AN1007 TaxID=3151385 RepID=A0AAU8NIU5_9BACL